MSKAKEMADIVDATRADTAERIKALELQTFAWRIVAIIGTKEPEKAVRMARWLFFVTVPFVHLERVQKFIDDNESYAQQCGIETGVFDK